MPLRIGHRGAAGYEHENTIRSFRRALDFGVDLIETDLRETGDGAIVLSHDRWIDLDGARRQVNTSTLPTLRAGAPLDARMATLQELLSLTAGRCGLMLEIKEPGLARRTVDAVAVARFPGPVIYASFHHDELLAIRRLQPDAQTLALIHAGPVHRTQFATDAQATHAGINIDFAEKEFVSALQESGLRVFVYTVDEPEDIAAMKALGVDGIISDYPDRL